MTLTPKVKVIGKKAGICDGVPSTAALVALSVFYLQPNFQKLFMLWTHFHAIVTRVLSEPKSINVIFLPYI